MVAIELQRWDQYNSDHGEEGFKVLRKKVGDDAEHGDGVGVLDQKGC
jgi:hypothetical protein